MKKHPGFSLIELMIAMVIAGILAGIAVPNVQRWQARDKFNAQALQVFQMLDSARNNAIAEKKCPNGNLSVGWEFEITEESPRVIHLNCDDGTQKDVVEEMTFDPRIDIEPNSLSLPWDVAPTENTLRVYFFSGSVTPKINDSFTTLSAKVPLISPLDLKKTLCLHRVSGIPSLTNNENCE
ncbi:prepilin-type N-terminal cleavage/methylation domain-containing protein [Candidatus Gracilibacteria bacterium]|nr:prepilin-type N-terminal cleavage/methylation domain-containing protein [Candidatus Gracilibacteria bacterium]